VDKVCKYGFGASLLDQPKLLGDLVKSMVTNSGDIPVSVKVRLGKSRINILENAKIIEDNGASVMTIHARKRLDKYDTEPDYEWIHKVKQNTNLQVWGNGSVFEAEDALELRKRTGCDNVMVARGALGNPFLFRKYNSLFEDSTDPGEPEITEVRDLTLKHIKLLSKEYNEIVAVDRAKKNVIWYFRRFKGIEVLLDKIFSIKTLPELEEFVQEHSEKIIQNKFKIDNRMEIERQFKKKVSFWLYNSFNTLQIAG
jgi:tRNA-dihydrouridine synthase B